LNLKATFRLQAYKSLKRREIENNSEVDDGKVHLLTIKGNDFEEIVNKYPAARKFFMVRSVARRAHFRKMFKETKNVY
jgi:hypothetical protein